MRNNTVDALVLVHLSSLDSYYRQMTDQHGNRGEEYVYNLAWSITDDVRSSTGPIILIDQDWEFTRDSKPRKEVLEVLGKRSDVTRLHFDEDSMSWRTFLPKLKAELARLGATSIRVGGVWWDDASSKTCRSVSGCATTVYCYLKKFFQVSVASVGDSGDLDNPPWGDELPEEDEDEVRDNPAPTPAISAMRLFHGTTKEEWAKAIMAGGLKPVSETGVKKLKPRSVMTPVAGKVYVTPSLWYATIYALGGVLMGYEVPPSYIKAYGRYGYLFEVSGAELVDVDPDEDVVGEAARIAMWPDSHVGAEPWKIALTDGNNKDLLTLLARLGRSSTTPLQLEDLFSETYSTYAAVGKKIVKKLPDWAKLRLIELGAHIAHQGPLSIIRAWRIDRLRSKEIELDAYNVLQIAEELPITHPRSNPMSVPNIHAGMNLSDAIRAAKQLGIEVSYPNATGEVLFAHRLGRVRHNSRRKDANRALTTLLRQVANERQTNLRANPDDSFLDDLMNALKDPLSL